MTKRNLKQPEQITAGQLWTVMQQEKSGAMQTLPEQGINLGS